METLLALLIASLNQAGAISALIAKLRAEGRDTLTAEEWQTVLDRDDAARAGQLAALARRAQETPR